MAVKCFIVQAPGKTSQGTYRTRIPKKSSIFVTFIFKTFFNFSKAEKQTWDLSVIFIYFISLCC